MSRPTLVHVTTTDMSLDWLLGPQLSAFADAGFDVVGMSAAGPHVADLEARGVRHVGLANATRAMAPRRDVAALVELYNLFRELRPDIVHTHNPKPGVYGRLAARAAAVPVVVNTVHGLYALPEDPWLKRMTVYGLERLAAAASDAELLQNPEDLPVLRRLGIPANRLYVLGNGIDLDRFDPDRSEERRHATRAALGIEPSDVLIGAVGRLVVEKGYVELLRAYEEVHEQFGGSRLVIVGPDDPDKADAVPSELIGSAEERGVSFLGQRSDLVDLYAAMDLYVLASHREGFPRSAMEAAAMGLPIVATDIRGCRQVVDHGETGLLVEPRDVPGLAAALAELVASPARRRSLGERARDKAVLEFDQRRIIDLTVDLYHRLLHRAGRTGPSA